MVEMEKAERDYEFLRECFSEVLQEIGESEVAAVVSSPGGAGGAIARRRLRKRNRSRFSS
jgi:hypothetical protein